VGFLRKKNQTPRGGAGSTGFGPTFRVGEEGRAGNHGCFLVVSRIGRQGGLFSTFTKVGMGGGRERGAIPGKPPLQEIRGAPSNWGRRGQKKGQGFSGGGFPGGPMPGQQKKRARFRKKHALGGKALR